MAPETKIDLNDLVDKLQNVFPMPHMFVKVLKEVNNPNSTSSSLERIFKYDPNLTMEILKLANSAYYGMPGKVTNIRSAIILLGLSLIKSLVLQTAVGDIFNKGDVTPHFSGFLLWKHSLGVGVCAKMISRRLRLGNAEDYFTLGVIHDIGLFLEHRFYGTLFQQVLARVNAQEGELIQIEQEVFGTDHAALTKVLCEKWEIPESLSQVVEYHHTPLQAPENLQRQACVIYLANYITKKNDFGFTYPSKEGLEPDLLKLLHLDRVDIEVMMEDFKQETSELAAFL